MGLHAQSPPLSYQTWLLLEADWPVLVLLLLTCRAVDAVCREGPARVLELVKMGADFTRNSGGLPATANRVMQGVQIVLAAEQPGRQSALLTGCRRLCAQQSQRVPDRQTSGAGAHAVLLPGSWY